MSSHRTCAPRDEVDLLLDRHSRFLPFRGSSAGPHPDILPQARCSQIEVTLPVELDKPLIDGYYRGTRGTKASESIPPGFRWHTFSTSTLTRTASVCVLFSLHVGRLLKSLQCWYSPPFKTCRCGVLDVVEREVDLLVRMGATCVCYAIHGAEDQEDGFYAVRGR